MNKFNVKTLVLMAALAAVTLSPAVSQAGWKVDAAHSSIGFSVKHMAVSKTKGTFDSFEAAFEFEPGQPESWSCTATVDVASVNTANEKRDDHLRSDDFFDVANFPTLTFTSTGVKMKNDEEGTVTGTLTMHGVTKEVELDLEVLGMVNDPWGNTRVGFSLEGKINRKDWGLAWSKVMEGGGLVVGEDVTLTIEIEGIQDK